MSQVFHLSRTFPRITGSPPKKKNLHVKKPSLVTFPSNIIQQYGIRVTFPLPLCHSYAFGSSIFHVRSIFPFSQAFAFAYTSTNLATADVR